jgi:putative ABC transport system ATP-binding protein
VIRVEGVSKNGSAGVVILREVSCRITPGEAVAIIGPSGAGKTTLLNLIGGVDAPTSGSIEVNGRLLARMSRRELAIFRRDTIGFVFQHYHLLPGLTVLENVSVPLLLKGLRPGEATRRAAECLEQVGLAVRARHLPEQLSGGERQRAAIARALTTNPPVLLADEPTGSLDSETGARVLELLQSLHQRLGMTMVIVTHDAAISTACGRVLQLRDGRLGATGGGGR